MRGFQESPLCPASILCNYMHSGHAYRIRLSKFRFIVLNMHSGKVLTVLHYANVQAAGRQNNARKDDKVPQQEIQAAMNINMSIPPTTHGISPSHLHKQKDSRQSQKQCFIFLYG